MIIRPKPGSV